MKFVDLHNDFLTKLNSKNIETYLSKNKNYVSNIFSAIWTTELKKPEKFIEKSHFLLKKLNTNINICLCLEDLGFVKDYKFLTKIKPYYCGLCWNNSNKFCGGINSKNSLTTKGKNLVNFLEKNNIIVDTAHMNKSSYNKFINISQKPIFCSHTGFYDIVKNKRNFCFGQLKDLVCSNGIVGLYFVGEYISTKNNAKIEDVIKNIDYFVNKFGYKNLSIGTDFYGTNNLPYNLKDYSSLTNLKQELLKIGYKKHQIDAIFYKNYEKFKKRS